MKTASFYEDSSEDTRRRESFRPSSRDADHSISGKVFCDPQMHLYQPLNQGVKGDGDIVPHFIIVGLYELQGVSNSLFVPVYSPKGLRLVRMAFKLCWCIAMPACLHLSQAHMAHLDQGGATSGVATEKPHAQRELCPFWLLSSSCGAVCHLPVAQQRRS